MISVHKSETVQCLTMFKQHSCRKDFLGGPDTYRTSLKMEEHDEEGKAAKVWRKIWEENKEISEKGRQGSSRNVEEETTRS